MGEKRTLVPATGALQHLVTRGLSNAGRPRLTPGPLPEPPSLRHPRLLGAAPFHPNLAMRGQRPLCRRLCRPRPSPKATPQFTKSHCSRASSRAPRCDHGLLENASRISREEGRGDLFIRTPLGLAPPGRATSTGCPRVVSHAAEKHMQGTRKPSAQLQLHLPCWSPQ